MEVSGKGVSFASSEKGLFWIILILYDTEKMKQQDGPGRGKEKLESREARCPEGWRPSGGLRHKEPSVGTQRELSRETPGGGLESMLGGNPGYQAEAAEIVDQALELLAQELVVGSQVFPQHLGEVCRLVVRGSPVEAY